MNKGCKTVLTDAEEKRLVMKMVEVARKRSNRKDEDGGEGFKAGYTLIRVGTLNGDDGEENQKDGQAVVAGKSRSSDSSSGEVEADHGTG